MCIKPAHLTSDEEVRFQSNVAQEDPSTSRKQVVWCPVVTVTVLVCCSISLRLQGMLWSIAGTMQDLLASAVYKSHVRSQTCMPTAVQHSIASQHLVFLQHPEGRCKSHDEQQEGWLHCPYICVRCVQSVAITTGCHVLSNVQMHQSATALLVQQATASRALLKEKKRKVYAFQRS